MDFLTRMKQTISNGMEESRGFLEKARDKVHDFGESSVVRLEIRQLESQARQEMAKLGTRVYELLIDEGKGSVSQKTPELKELLSAIENIKHKIADKEIQLKEEESEKSQE